MKNSLEIIKKTIKEYALLSPSDTVLVAFSGGADSVCLALALLKLGYSIALAHVNHGLRAEASSDVLFCKNFAKKFNIPFYLGEFDVEKIAQKEKISCETAGRNVRYAFFNSISGYTKIATAHHKNDCAETVLQHLLRGSGLKGLCGILPQRENIVRPLLGLTKKEIEDFVFEAGIIPCTDKTNFETDFLRNRIRLTVIPLLEKENEKAVDNICATASLLSEDEDYLIKEAQKYTDCNRISIATLKTLHPAIASRAVRLAYKSAAGTVKDLEQKHVKLILAHLKNHGKIADLALQIEAVAEYGTLVFRKNETSVAKAFCYPLKINGETEIPELSLKLITEVAKEKGKDGVYFDFDKLKGQNLYVRSKAEGDCFIPFGMAGTKSLKKLLVDLKVPREERKNVSLVTTNTEILWVIEKKRSNLYTVDKNTKNFLRIREEKNL